MVLMAARYIAGRGDRRGGKRGADPKGKEGLADL
jgi:hypothetical protein